MLNTKNFDNTDPSQRFTVGVFLDSPDNYITTRLVKDLLDKAEEKNIQLIFFFGDSLDKDENSGPSSYAFSIPSSETIDALIVFPHLIAPYNPIKNIEPILANFSDTPIYSCLERLPNRFSVIVNESDAIEELITHLVKTHSYKKFSLLTGPLSKDSVSMRRLTLIKENLQNYGISLNQNLCFPGIFSENDGKKTAQDLLFDRDNSPDVLICFNDQMAIGAIKEFQNNGLSVPHDIAIVGFDDVQENNFLPCSLTTINFPIYNICSVLIEKISNDLLLRTPYSNETIKFNAEFMNRESCGCENWFDTSTYKTKAFNVLAQKRQPINSLKQSLNIRHELEDKFEKSFATKDHRSFSEYIVNTIKKLIHSEELSDSFIENLSTEWMLALYKYKENSQQQSINLLFIDAFKALLQEKTALLSKTQSDNQGNLQFFRECNDLVSRRLTINEALIGLGKQLSLLSISNILVVFFAPDTLTEGEIRLNYQEENPAKIYEAPLPRIKVTELYPKDSVYKNNHIALMPIAHNGNNFGYILATINNKQINQFGLIQEMITHLVSTSADNLIVSDHIEALTKKNESLFQLSLIDEVTSLKNRRALYSTGRTMYKKAQNSKESSCFIFLDLDGLKHINDNFGHTAGDTAIKTLAKILKNTFRENDLVVRYGGDEFVVIMTNIQEEVLEKTLTRIANNIQMYNDKEQNKWTLSVSWGVVFNKETKPYKSFESILEESDALLYRAKAKKRNSALTI